MLDKSNSELKHILIQCKAAGLFHFLVRGVQRPSAHSVKQNPGSIRWKIDEKKKKALATKSSAWCCSCVFSDLRS